MTTAAALGLPRQRPGLAADRALAVREVIDGRRPVRLVLQPIVALRAGRVVGYEALARFGTRTSTPPGPWFAAAGRQHQSAQLEAVLIERALQDRAALPPDCYLSVNVSPALLATPVVRRAFATTPDLSGVVVELTEHVEFVDSSLLHEALTDLRSRGARLALDDVGSGWAGLRQVTELRPDIVKLDRSLVRSADRDEVKLALAEMLLRLCSRLGSQLLVEGVETYDELEVFARLGVPLAQGWVFGKPAVLPPRIDDDLSVRLKFLAGLQRHTGAVASLVDVTAATCLDRPPTQDRAAVCAGLVVGLDRLGRPLAVHAWDGGRWLRAPAMTVLATESVSQVLLRAMTRPSPTRFLPVVCVHRTGQWAGVITIEALARAAARQSETVEVELVLPG